MSALKHEGWQAAGGWDGAGDQDGRSGEVEPADARPLDEDLTDPGVMLCDGELLARLEHWR